jgi:ATP/maltotriose-dependent transcriptional regulator MalT
MAQGNTTQEIGAKLIAGAGTIKANMASTYRKLEVVNRAEAFARARHLGILF